MELEVIKYGVVPPIIRLETGSMLASLRTRGKRDTHNDHSLGISGRFLLMMTKKRSSFIAKVKNLL